MESYLYSLVPHDYLVQMLDTFYACVSIPVQVIDEQGTILESCGSVTNFCNIFKKRLSSEDSCKNIHINASKRAVGLGETYIFACHANLNHIVFPLISNKSFLGSILVGPFLLDTPDSTLVADIAQKYKISTEDLLDLYDELGSVQVIAPSKATYISKLLYFLFSNVIADGKAQLKINQEKLHQQSRINESIQMYKTPGAPITSSYPYEKEKELVSKVKNGDIAAAKGILNDLLGYVFFSEGSSLDIVKTRSVELSSILSRATIEGGASTDTVLKLNNQFLKNLQEAQDIDSLCYMLQEIVVAFVESMFHYLPNQKNNEAVKKAIYYIAHNFDSNITLESVAEYVHLNPAYFSSVFKQSSGSTFKEYLNIVRIEESKRLLSNTNYPIIDIAIASGFEDQSYFSKVFKRYTGLSPRQFRK